MTTLGSCSYGPDKVIYNSTDYRLTESEKSVLCKGLKFSIPPNKQILRCPLAFVL